MNADELMIGDWVWTSGHPVQIETILRHKVGYLKQYFKEFEFLEPIPLAEEILKANGFVMYKKNWAASYWLLYHDGNTIEFLWEEGKQSLREITVGGYDVNLDYVHELQHVLHLCGLNDLANNLKIEE